MGRDAASSADARSSAAVLRHAGFRCEALLAQKPTTEVWRARLPDDRACVIKCATAGSAGNRGVARLIEREWQYLQAAALPGVVTVFALAQSARGPVLVTDYLPNGDLVTLAGSHPRHWAVATHTLAGTLQALHGRGIVHRDIKPRNVLFDANEQATLIDFAAAARCGTRAPAGGTTAAYRLPSGAADRVVDPAEDAYAYAAVLHELLAGRPPFGASSKRPAREAFVPLCPEHVVAGDEPAVGALVAIVNDALRGPCEEPRTLLAVFQSALSAIIATR